MADNSSTGTAGDDKELQAERGALKNSWSLLAEGEATGPARCKTLRGLWVTTLEEDEWLDNLSLAYPHQFDKVMAWSLSQESTGSGKASRDSSSTTGIPRIIHQIWLGGDLPSDLRSFCESWRAHHPQWQQALSSFADLQRLWTDTEISSGELRLRNQVAFDAAKNYGEKADILRYELLHTFGGLYVDCDFECLASFEIFHQNFDFFCGFSNTGAVELNNALLGSKAGHPILGQLIDDIGHQFRTASLVASYLGSGNSGTSPLAELVIPALVPSLARNAGRSTRQTEDVVIPVIDGAIRVGEDEDESKRGSSAPLRTIGRTGPGLLTRVAIKYYLSHAQKYPQGKELFLLSSVYFAPEQFFYPIPNTEQMPPGADSEPSKSSEKDDHLEALGSTRRLPLRKSYALASAYAVHHWRRSWIPQTTPKGTTSASTV